MHTELKRPPGGPVEATIRGILDGDAEATAWLYDRFAPALFRRLGQRYGYLGREELEDLVQETFLLVLRNERRLLGGFSARIRPSGAPTEQELERFLWDQACGLASNRRRSAPFRKVVPLEEGREGREGPLVADREEQQAIDRDLLIHLDACLQQRGSRIYLYYKLRLRDGLSPEEITQVTGWSRKVTYKLRQTLDEAVQRCAEKLRLGEP